MRFCVILSLMGIRGWWKCDDVVKDSSSIENTRQFNHSRHSHSQSSSTQGRPLCRMESTYGCACPSTVDVHTRKRASEETPVRYVKKRRPHPPHCFPPHPLFLLPAFSHLPEALFNNQRISWTLSTLRVTPPSGPVATIRQPYGPRPQAPCSPRPSSASIWAWIANSR